MNRESWINDALAGLRAEHLERRARAYPQAGGRIVMDGRTFLNFSSNDYLGLAHDPRVVAAAEAALREHGAGATASRLVTGTLALHEELERRLAAFKGYDAALVFGSGFLTNAGVIPSLVGRDDTVFADRLVHASILDAVALSRARLARFQHNDPASLESALVKYPPSGRRLIVTESVFSMDGDLAPLPEIAALAGTYDAMLMVDEAHATGIFGPGGSGLIREHHLESAVNISMGTLSKALGGYGGFVACSKPARELFVNLARAFIYTTAPPPAAIGAALGALDVLTASPDLGAQLLARSAKFRSLLQKGGLDTMRSASQIIPVKVGANDKALLLADRLRKEGVLAVAIRPPTVPEGTARLRLSVSLSHSEADLESAAATILAAASAEGVV